MLRVINGAASREQWARAINMVVMTTAWWLERERWQHGEMEEKKTDNGHHCLGSGIGGDGTLTIARGITRRGVAREKRSCERL